MYVAGFTASADFPAASRPNGGSTDGFVARLSASGTLQFATFIGGSGSDLANGLALKNDGSVWVVGETDSADLTLRGVPYQAVNRGGLDAFLPASMPMDRLLTPGTLEERAPIEPSQLRWMLLAKCTLPALQRRRHNSR